MTRRMIGPTMALITTAALLAACAQGGGPHIADIPECGDFDFATTYLDAFADARNLDHVEEVVAEIDTLAKAECHQDRVIALTKSDGRKGIGFKAGLVTAGAQARFDVPGPIIGVLFEGMMLQDGAAIDLASGGRLIYELDLLARVSDDAINDAETLFDAAASLDAIYPFIEVADLMVPAGAPITGPLVVAMNVAPRWGVMGNPIAVTADESFIAALADMRVMLKAEDGTVLVEAVGRDLADNPLNIALYLAREAKRRGWRLREGDLLSLGSFGPFQFPTVGDKVVAVYEGLSGGTAAVTVRFE